VEDYKNPWEVIVPALVYGDWIPEAVKTAFSKKYNEIYRLCKYAEHQKTLVKPQSWQIELEKYNKNTLRILPKLFTVNTIDSDFGNTRLELLWKEIESIASIDLEKFVHVITVAHLNNGYPSEKMTNKERRDWQSNVQTESRKLRESIEHSKYNLTLQAFTPELFRCLLMVLQDANIEVSPETKQRLALYMVEGLPNLNEVLYKIETTTEHDLDATPFLSRYIGSESPSLVQMTSPNSVNANRTYFAKYVTNYLVETTGKPQRKVVHEIINCLFGEIDERTLQKIAKVS
jgi:hypothetical protein